ncbi:hypothetical protein JI59_15050 [Novosphingobium pentaromativorans US6-1]|nr:hypothetical protein JI59_15050 [Novosphingobium pentaromativorans US6-1]
MLSWLGKFRLQRAAWIISVPALLRAQSLPLETKSGALITACSSMVRVKCAPHFTPSQQREALSVQIPACEFRLLLVPHMADPRS